MPQIIILGGCNGAGKTTAAYSILRDVLEVIQFINADEIAKGLSPFAPETVAIEAGRIMLDRLKELEILHLKLLWHLERLCLF